MPSFRVEPSALDEHGASIIRIESFRVLAESVGDRRSRLAPSSATSAAVDTLEQRLFERLAHLSTVIDAVGSATQLAADRYSTTETSIAATAGRTTSDTSIG